MCSAPLTAPRERAAGMGRRDRREPGRPAPRLCAGACASGRRRSPGWWRVETGKSLKDARGETDGAVEMGMFVAGEGRRFYGRTTTSAVPNKTALTVRQPLGVAGLIIAANTPIANVAWKVFPGAPLRKRRGPQGLRGHAAERLGVRAPRGGGGASPPACSM